MEKNKNLIENYVELLKSAKFKSISQEDMYDIFFNSLTSFAGDELKSADLSPQKLALMLPKKESVGIDSRYLEDRYNRMQIERINSVLDVIFHSYFTAFKISDNLPSPTQKFNIELEKCFFNEKAPKFFEGIIDEKSTSFEDLYAFNYAIKNMGELIKNDLLPSLVLDSVLCQSLSAFQNNLVKEGVNNALLQIEGIDTLMDAPKLQIYLEMISYRTQNAVSLADFPQIAKLFDESGNLLSAQEIFKNYETEKLSCLSKSENKDTKDTLKQTEKRFSSYFYSILSQMDSDDVNEQFSSFSSQDRQEFLNVSTLAYSENVKNYDDAIDYTISVLGENSNYEKYVLNGKNKIFEKSISRIQKPVFQLAEAVEKIERKESNATDFDVDSKDAYDYSRESNECESGREK